MKWTKKIVVGGMLPLLAAYALRRTIIARWFELSPAKYDVTLYRDLRVPTSDGFTLATDHYAPATAAQSSKTFPTILIRTPYGKRLAPAFHARRFAERGYHVVVQDVRGRFASTGRFEPFVHEEADGAATLTWLHKQPWFNGKLGTWGQSYLAYTQWAVAMASPESVTALFPSLPSSRGPFSAQVDGARLLELPLRWMVVLDALRHLPGGRGTLAPWRAFWRLLPQGQETTLAGVFLGHVPLEEGDVQAIGRQIPYFRQVMADFTPPEWSDLDYGDRVSNMRAPVHFLGGWYDFMLGDMLRDYGALRAAGNRPFLTIGPWHHVHREISRVTLREGLDWFDAHLKGRRQHLRRKAVRVYVMGAGEWRAYEEWPPPTQATSFYLQSGKRLSSEPAAADSPPDRYLFDPNDPTPAVGGALFFHGAGSRDNRELESRADVLVYTSARLTHDLEVIGPVRCVLYVSSTRPYADFFARLCDVHPDGRSINICDGIVRLSPGKGERLDSGAMHVEIDMWATAHRFCRGHALRLQISSGAHPRFAPNSGRANPPQSRQDMHIARQTIYHDAQHPSALILPLVA
jgi:putative CocE/NonD family hydrolase